MQQDPERNWYAAPQAQGGAQGGHVPFDTDEIEVQPATFGVRAVARIIDSVLAIVFGLAGGAAGGLLAAFLGQAGVLDPGWLSRLGGTTAGNFLFALASAVTYATFAEGLGGATIGKLICGLRVLSVDRAPCSLGRAFGRSLAYYIDALFCGLIGYMSMSSSPMQQRYGDKWAGTIVVQAASVPSHAKRDAVVPVIAGIVGYLAVAAASIVINAM